MILTLVRYESDAQKTLGKLYIDGLFECFILEDSFRPVKIKHETRIPAGKYQLELSFSPKFSPSYKHHLILLKDVPGFSGIRIHRGNLPSDSSGCLLTGLGTTKNGVVSSKKAYDALYSKVAKVINTGRAVFITVIDNDR